MRFSNPRIATHIRIFFTLIISLSFIPGKGQLHINEFQASNISTILDPTGNYREWIEIYNSGNTSVNLEGYFLSTDLSNPFYREITNVQINANSFAIIWLDKSEDDPCCEFQLEMDGGEVGLFSPSGELLDSVRFQLQYLDVAFGRSPDGSNHWAYFDTPTPAAPNNTIAIENNTLSEEVIFSLEGGFHDGNQLLELSSGSNDGDIRYTLDGSWPTPSSLNYSVPIQLTSNGVIRARLYQNGMLPGPVTTKTYILNDSSSIPVVSIVTDAKHFFDDKTGIYVEGTNGVTGKCMEDPVNWNREWERPANIEYFTKEGMSVINQVAGVRIHGGCSRIWDYKSIAVIARHKYGDNSLSYQFFSSKEVDSFKSLVFRNSGGDAYYSMLRDGFMQTLLMGNIDVDCQGYQPANVFLNGEYWGILNVREKINEHHPASNYNLDSDDIDMLEREKYLLYKEVVHGSGEHYEALINFIKENSVSIEANYEYVKTQMDVDEFMNYFLTEIYFENEDWPNNNVKYWRPHVEGGKWRWLLYDTDMGWDLVPRSNNSVEEATNTGNPSRLINELLESDEFRDEFIQRMAGFINTTFNPINVVPIYDSIKGQLDKEIERHISRWNRPRPDSYENHTENIIPKFTQERPNIVRGHVRDFFGISGMYTLFADVNNPDEGYIKASEVILPANFSGSYFDDIPLRLIAIPHSGYTFSHWEGASNSDSESIYLDVSNDATIRAVFKPDLPMSKVYINEVCASNESMGADNFGQFEDWIEIYNDNDTDVNLAGWYLSDSVGLATKFRIPTGQADLTTVRANDYLIIWCDKDIRQGPLHSSFKLKREGEVVTLVQQIDQKLHYVDSIHYPQLQPDLTYGRLPDSGSWEYMSPTPLALNEPGEPFEIYINEWMTRNCGTQTDEFDEADDWIEIYNPTSDTIDLGGLYLTDSLQDPLKHKIPVGSNTTTIPPYGYKILWADSQPEQGALHLGFKLDGKTEQIGLYLLGEGYLDSLSYNLHQSGMAMGRYSDGSDLIQSLTASPGEPNFVQTIENIYINEVMAKNSSTASDQFGEHDDWIEIYNDNEFDVDLGGLYITDSLSYPAKSRIPTCESHLTTIPAKGYIILWADDQEEQGALHLDFKLNGGGEEIGLVQADGTTFIDSVSFPDQYSNFSYSRTDNVGSWSFLRPTHKSFNENSPISGIHINEFMASNTSSTDSNPESSDWIELYNANDFPVDIGGLYLTDTIGDPGKFRIPSHSPELTTLPPEGFFVLYADDMKELGLNHTNFKLSRKGEAIFLFHYDELTILDSVTYSEQYKNSASGCILESGDWWVIPPTPGESNVVPDVSDLVINEVMGNNKTIYEDEYNEYDDWIELYNSGDEPLDVGGLYLSDSLADPTVFRISSEYPDSTTIPPGSYLILWGDNSTEQGILHLGFKISKTGETIGVFDYTEELIDSIYYPFISPNLSWGRIVDGDANWTSFQSPTPMMANAYTSVQAEKLQSGAVSIYPNPATDHAVFEVILNEGSDLIIEIIDNRGIICTTIRDYHYGNGKQLFHWNVEDASGSRLESGFYYCRILTGDGVFTGKMVVK